MKKLLVLLLALMLLIPSAMAENEVELTVFGTGVTIPEDDPVIPEFGKQIGVTIKFENMMADTAALITRIAGGDIPDLFRVGDLSIIGTLYDSGAVLNVRDYLDQMPNVKATNGDNAAYWAPVTFDGGYYAVPRRAQVNFQSWYIRTDWLEKLNLKMPTSMDEVLKVAIAMNEADFDGNGKADTYTITGSKMAHRAGAFNGFFTAYGVTYPTTIMIRDNKPVYACTTPEFKMAIEEIRRFVEAGVVDPEIVSNTMDSLREKAASNKAGIVYTGWTEFSKQAYVDILTSVDPNAKWAHIPSFTTEYGAYGAAQTAVNYSVAYCMNADLADQPEKLAAALKLFDYSIHGAGDMLLSYGIEGQHYEIVDGKVVKLPGMNSYTYNWGFQFTGRDEKVYNLTKFPECADEVIYAASEIPILYHYDGYVRQPEGINVADIKSYEEEQITQFIFGGRDMSEWDSFIDTLYNVYNLKGYMDSATEQLTEMGFITK